VKRGPSSSLADLRQEALRGGGEERVAAQHAKGKLTARERVALLLDEGTFEELDMLVRHRTTEFGMDRQRYVGDGVVTGHGKVHGRTVFLFSQDFTVLGGSLSEANAGKIVKVMDLALRVGRRSWGCATRAARAFRRAWPAWAATPRSSCATPAVGSRAADLAVLGPCAGGAVYSPAITDFIFMTERTSYMYVTGPHVARTVTHEVVDHETLGGAQVHRRRAASRISWPGTMHPASSPSATCSATCPTTTPPRRRSLRRATISSARTPSSTPWSRPTP
jgi:propionyl-CoA carboxylase beta chain